MDRVVTEVGSVLNGHRRKLLTLLRDPGVTTIVVEYPDRFARFGAEYVQAVLSGSGRRLLVVDPAEVDDDLVPDVKEILTSLCARLYGRRAAASRAARGVAAIVQDTPQALQAYRFALDPTSTQARMLRSHCGAGRVGFNWGLAHVKAVMGQREAEATYGISEEGLTPTVWWSLYCLRKGWNRAKGDVAPWWGQCSKEAFNTGLDGLARSLKNWGDSRTGKRKGGPVGFPRFKSKHRSRGSVRFTTGAIRCETKHAVLPRLGRIKLQEDASALVGKVEAGTARVLSAAVRFERGRWFVSFTVDTQRPVLGPARPDAVVGVDLGVKTLAVLSSGQEFPNPRHCNGAARKVRHLSRTVSRRVGPYDNATQKRRDPSNRWRRASGALAKAQGRVADRRRDGLHKLTTSLASQFGTVVIEDLYVAGMVKNHRLARHIADASFGELRRQLEYKTVWCGGRTVVVDRWFPSSKTCSGCGVVKTKLDLPVRTYVCTECGLVLDRDVNAARNLAVLGEVMVAGSGPETVNGRGGQRVLPPACETSTRGCASG